MSLIAFVIVSMLPSNSALTYVRRAIEGNVFLFRKGFIAIVVGTLLAIFLACILGVLIELPEYGSEVVSRSEPTLLDLWIAVAAGGISGFPKVQPKVSATLSGTAIAPNEKSFEVGVAIAKIQDLPLYHENYDTFEDYCRNRWKIRCPHACRFIDAAVVPQTLPPIGDIPTTEKQARRKAILRPSVQVICHFCDAEIR